MAGRVSAAKALPGRLIAGGARLRPRRWRSRRRNRVLAALAFLGPGLIAANAGNDAGGIATYSSVGATYGYDLLWMMVVITVSLIVVQEMAARMGAVTGKGLAELIREQYGVRWSLFATVSRAGRERRHLHLGVRRHRRRARPRRRAGAGVGADRRGRRLAAPDPRLVQAWPSGSSC